MISFQDDPLRFVLNLAYDQAMRGKGIERHGDGKPFDEQIGSIITKSVGLGFPLGQAWKKWDESKKLVAKAALAEILGAINYLAMAAIPIIKGLEKK